jgi:hypothetical protein
MTTEAYLQKQLYYLLDLHLTCSYISKYNDGIIHKFIQFVNNISRQELSIAEQKQLNLCNFNISNFYEIANGNINKNISFEGIEPVKLHAFFDKICIMDVVGFL